MDPDALRAARRAAGLTQAQLAQRVGVADGSRVAAWEAGRATPHPSTVVVLRDVLGIPAPITTDVTLRQLRLERGMALREVAVAIGVHPSTVSRWESGLQEPSRKHVAALREVLEVEHLPHERN